MNRKLPHDAFANYFAQGPSRSYEAVAKRYGVSKRAVATLALREDWQGRLVELERKARERVDEKAVETLEDMNSRHLKVLRYIQNKAIEALKAMPIDSAMDAVRAFSLSIDKERTIRGEPTDRSAVSVEEIIKREYQTLLVTPEQAEPPLRCSRVACNRTWAAIMRIAIQRLRRSMGHLLRRLNELERIATDAASPSRHEDQPGAGRPARRRPRDRGARR